MSETVDLFAQEGEVLNPFFASIPKLDGANYLLWSRSLLNVIEGHDKEHIITDDEPEDKTGKFATWKRDNAMVKAWIMSSCVQRVANDIACCGTAKCMWDNLRLMYFEEKNYANILQMCVDVSRMKQNGRPLAQYYSYLDTIFQRLNSYMPVCTCGTQSLFRSQLMVGLFLGGLDPLYEAARAQMIDAPEIPSMEAAYSRLSELSISVPADDEQIEITSTLATSSGGRGNFLRGRGRRRDKHVHVPPQCAFGGCIGHTNDCYGGNHGNHPMANQGSPIQPVDTSSVLTRVDNDLIQGLGHHRLTSQHTSSTSGGSKAETKTATITCRSGLLQGNMQECHKRYVALKIMYFGQRFFGFASEAHSDPTVESEIFKALAKTKLAIGSKEEINYSRCGRTDKGVSSSGQVIALYLRSALKNSETRGEKQEEIDYVKVLNRVLPNDIRVMGWSPVPAFFHARFSCLRREYKYFFWRDKMDIAAMQDAGKRFIGEHDFRNFCKMDALNVSNYMRQITTFEIRSCNERHGDDELCAIIIGGSAFLWHQVRCMVALLFMIGQGLESPLIIDLLLDTNKIPRKPQYNMAPELSLVLRSCEFEELIFHCSQDAQRALVAHLNSTIQVYLLQAAIFREALDSVAVSGQSMKKRAHIPILKRPTEPSYEERRAKLESKNNAAQQPVPD